MNDFFKIYRDFQKHYRPELVLSPAAVVRINNVCNRFRSKQLQIRLTFLMFFSFTLTFLQSMVGEILMRSAEQFRDSTLLIISWFPRGILNEFSESMLFFFFLSVPGLVLAKLVVFIFFRKSHMWPIVFLRKFRLASVFLSTWIVFSLNVAPILILSYLTAPDLQLTTMKVYTAILLVELTATLTIVGAAGLIWLERRMRAPRETALTGLFLTIKGLKELKIGSSDRVELIIQRLRRLGRDFQRLGRADSASEKFSRVSRCLDLYATWMATPYQQTPVEIIDRLRVITRAISSGNLADLVLPEFNNPKTEKSSKYGSIRMLVLFLVFVALPIGTVLVLSSLNDKLIPSESMTFLLTSFFVVWSVVGVYLFVKEAVPDLFVDILAILKGKN